LFLVFAFDVGFAADRFAVGNFWGRLQREVDGGNACGVWPHDFNVLLAGTGEQEFFRLRSREKRSAGSSSRIL